MNRIGMLLIAGMLLAGLCFACSVTPLYDGPGVTQTVEGAFTFSNLVDPTLDGGEQILSSSNEIVTVFDDDEVVLGVERVDTSVGGGSVAAGDEFRREWTADNDATQDVTIARIVGDFTDETDTTEDGTYEVWVQVAGTLTKIATVNVSGMTVVG